MMYHCVPTVLWFSKATMAKCPLLEKKTADHLLSNTSWPLAAEFPQERHLVLPGTSFWDQTARSMLQDSGTQEWHSASWILFQTKGVVRNRQNIQWTNLQGAPNTTVSPPLQQVQQHRCFLQSQLSMVYQCTSFRQVQSCAFTELMRNYCRWQWNISWSTVFTRV